MNLWFRLIWMLLTVRWRKRVGIFDTTTIRMRVLPNDLDLNGHVNNGRYLTLADVGRMDYTIRTGLLKIAFAERALPVVGDITAKFRRELRLFDRFDLHTRLLGWDGKWAFVEHRFVRRGQVVGVVVMRGLFRKRSGAVDPSVILSRLGLTSQQPPLPDWVLEWHRGCNQLAGELHEEEQTQGVNV